MNAVVSRIKRVVVFRIAVFPVFGRSMYERLSSRLDRQIAIRERKRKRRIEPNSVHPEINIYSELDRLISREAEIDRDTEFAVNKPMNLLVLR